MAALDGGAWMKGWWFEHVEVRAAESVDERVVGRDGGGGVNGGECVGCVEGRRWWRRWRSAGGAGGGGVNNAAALRWRRWRRWRERGVGVGDDDGDGGGGEGGGGEVGWLKSSMPNARHKGGVSYGQATAARNRGRCGQLSHPLVTS